VNVWDNNKSSDVTIRAADGATVTIGFNLGNASHFRFQNLTITSFQGGNGSDYTGDITLTHCTFLGQVVIRSLGSKFLIDSCSFDNISVCASCYEGRLQIAGNSAQVVVSNCHFGGPGESDGIQINSDGGVVVGPGNVFDGIVQGSYSRHVDAIQLYAPSNVTITGNYFNNGTTFIMAPDGGINNVVTNNVFNGSKESYSYKLQFGSQENLVFRNNTLVGASVAIDSKTGSKASANALVQNNILVDGGFKTSGGSGCTNCTLSFNLFGSSGNAVGTSNLIGLPTFVGGLTPTSYVGYQLTSDSKGFLAGSDGKDMGVGFATLPNPAEVVIPFRGMTGRAIHRIYSVQGNLVGTCSGDFSEKGLRTSFRAMKSHLPSGLYFVRTLLNGQRIVIRGVVFH